MFLAVRAPHVGEVGGPAPFRAPVALLKSIQFFPRGGVHAAQAADAVVVETAAAQRREVGAPRANAVDFLIEHH